ncbi:MAG: hypothetical protein A3C07_00470 [Candidatus Sungbacteria bacterium RIFCSPHIGHO2_02_FULL_47_11]|uniref:histidine kinase n=1 Tax=Candidatus Sungbacteria bacterium RIFCSPHIGHO2_02_FULL_47_11 TaxID=1802270 RepID=A0A1G2KIK6_9BACT|nr:MAG: hypothetical protein A3C07_00470 [Candidatus Sungbacteria bacterium RIFCSPHIGHO2_02_FULL_47_11]
MRNILPKITGSALRNKLILFFIVLAATPLLVLGIIALVLIDFSHRHDVSNLQVQLIDQKTKEIEKFLTDTLGVLELRVGFVQKSEVERSQQEFLLAGLLEENNAFEEASFINLDGMEASKLVRGQEGVELFDVSRLEKFRTAAAGRHFIGDVYNTLSGPMVILAAPVRNRSGEIIQVLSAAVSMSPVTRSIETAVLGTSGYVLLVDRDGALIAAGAPAVRGIDLSGSARVRRILDGAFVNGLDEQDHYESIIDKTPVVGAGKRISSTGWAVLTEWPLQDADALMNEIRDQVVSLTVFSIIAVLLLALLFANRLLKPIRMLAEGVREIEKGKLDKRVEIKTQDELEELGVAFNRMAEGLKRLQELQNEFTFIAAHELRSPVTVIRGYISLAMRDKNGIPENVREYLLEADKANQRLLQLVQDLLEAARSEAGKIVIKVQPLVLKESIQAVLAEMKSLADEKSVALSFECPETLPKVLADDGRLKEIMVNLVGNAIKYSNPGGNVLITHEVRGHELITHVKDDGFGISHEAQKRLFEKFYRVHSEKTRDIPGTGLGLFIVKELVGRMGGNVWVESDEGKGSTFSFSLPIA